MEEIMVGSSLLAQIDMEIERGRVKLYRSTVFIGSQTTYCFQTVGLFRFDMPEIVLFGIDSESVLAHVIDLLIEDSVSGRSRVIEGLLPLDYFSRNAYGVEVDPLRVENYCYLIYSYYEAKGLKSPRIVQWVFADDEGRFPWNPEADVSVTSVQKLLIHSAS